MAYQHPHQLDTRRSLLLDVYEISHLIQNLLEEVLQPPAKGLYLPEHLDPIMVPGKEYWYEKPVFVDGPASIPKRKINMDLKVDYAGRIVDGQLVASLASQDRPWQYYTYEYFQVGNLEQVCQTPWDILATNPNFDSRPKQVLLPHHLAPLVTAQPTAPSIGLKLIRHIVQMDIDSTRAYLPDRSPFMLERATLPFLQSKYQVLEHIREDPWFQDTFNCVFDNIRLCLDPIRNSMRHNPYQIATVEYADNYQLRVNQLGDYRVKEYESITQDPQYTTWLKARENGDWDRYLSEREEIATNNSANIGSTNPYR